MLSALRPAVVMTTLFTLLLGVAYPLAVTGIGQVAFPAQADGKGQVPAVGELALSRGQR